MLQQDKNLLEKAQDFIFEGGEATDRAPGNIEKKGRSARDDDPVSYRCAQRH